MWHVNLAPVCLLYIWVRFKRISVCDSVTGYNGWTDSNGHKYDTWCISAACTRGRMIDHTDHNTFYGCYSSFMWLAAIHPITHTHAYIHTSSNISFGTHALHGQKSKCNSIPPSSGHLKITAFYLSLNQACLWKRHINYPDMYLYILI